MKIADYYNYVLINEENPGERATNYYGIIDDVINKNNMKRIAEIGIGYGSHAKHILKHTNIRKLYLIDPMIWQDNDVFFNDILKCESESGNSFDELCGLIKKELNPWESKYQWFRKKSSEITDREIPDESLDLVFIHGVHDYKRVLENLNFWIKKVKKGGQLLGDDIFIESVKDAVVDFSKQTSLKYDYLTLPNNNYKIYRFLLNLPDKPVFIINKETGRFGNKIIRYAALTCLLKNYKYNFSPIIVGDKILPLKYNNGSNNIQGLEQKEITNIQEFNESIFNEQCIINLNGWYQRYSYFNNEEIRNDIINAFGVITPLNETVIHVRCGDQWLYNKPPGCPVHPYQPVLPIRFYLKLLKSNNLPVRFVCESLNDKFIERLKLVFPHAIFQSSSVIEDFITLLSAKKLILSVSTFSWCAGWLNNVAEEIIVPSIGFFNRDCVNSYDDDREKVDFIINEPRYKYTEVESYDIYKKWLGNDIDYENAIAISASTL